MGSSSDDFSVVVSQQPREEVWHDFRSSLVIDGEDFSDLDLLQAFRVEGCDKHGNRIFRIVGKFFPGLSLYVYALFLTYPFLFFCSNSWFLDTQVRFLGNPLFSAPPLLKFYYNSWFLDTQMRFLGNMLFSAPLLFKFYYNSWFLDTQLSVFVEFALFVATAFQFPFQFMISRHPSPTLGIWFVSFLNNSGSGVLRIRYWRIVSPYVY